MTEENTSSHPPAHDAAEADPDAGNGPIADDPPESPSSERSAEPEQPVDPLQSAQAEATKLRDQLLRTAADFDNFRKRSRREIGDAERRAREDLLRDLLPVFDNLERAASHADSASDVKALADGISMVMRQFVDTLKKLGVERVDAVGQPFDPAVHEAIQHLETPDHPPGTVTAEVQAGYKAGDRLVRPSMVVVAKAPSEASE